MGVLYAGLTLVAAVVAIALAKHFSLGVPQTLVGVLLALGPGYMAWAAFRADRVEAGATSVEALTDRLAETIARQWSDEATVRRINDPYPLPVAWQFEADLAEEWGLLCEMAANWPGGPPGDRTRWPASPADLAGAGPGIGRVFSDLIPTRRLVVLGGPGAGKSVLMMQLLQDLLSRRASGQPVPVLLSLASWNPEQQRLRQWLAAELRRTYPGLAAPAPVPATAGTVPDLATLLVDTDRVLPLLDGLDELPADWHAPALDAINQDLAAGQPIALATRTPDYQRALSHGSIRINGSAAIALQPLNAREAAAYLRRDAGGAGTRGPARWDTVTAQLGTTTPVGRALGTPINLFLARTIYNPRPGAGPVPPAIEPAELCDTFRFPSRAAVEDHLFSAYIPAAYAPHPSRPSRWNAEQATRALTYLATFQEAHRAGSPDLAWWELAGAPTARLTARGEGPPRFTDATRSALVAWAVTALLTDVSVTVGEAVSSHSATDTALAPLQALIPSILLGGICAFFTGSFAAVSKRHAGQRTRLRWRPAAALSVLVGAPVAALSFTALASLGAGVVGPALLAVLLGTGVGFTTVLGAPRIVPHPAMRIRPRRGLWGGFVAGGFGAIAAFRTDTLWTGLPTLFLVCWVITNMFMLSTPAPVLQGTLGPGALYHHDRASFLAVVTSVTLGLATMIAILTGDMLSTASIISGVCGGLAIALSYGLGSTAWPYLTLIRSWLTLQGHLPPRLLPFLKDAHENRGVLRRAGPVYQFRHVELQRHLGQRLADEPEATPAQIAR
ncbi:NACHT domain-containing protein [Streptomyces sp. NPDC102467]|uniref:NACHT domain-containing protein n=1 Tax=Streptomyces sp. NPDC102467 TaxID=3366179 RepID=UPI00380BDBB0